MYWVLEQNLFQEEGFAAVLAALQVRGLPHEVVRTRLFSEEAPYEEQFDCPVDPQGATVVLGSTTLSRIAQVRGWSPGSFLGSNHDFQVWGRHLRGHLLNEDARTCRMDEVPEQDGPFFVRPCGDDKNFAGRVTDWAAYLKMLDKVRAAIKPLVFVDDDGKEEVVVPYTSLRPDTMVLYGPVRDISMETRFFVVDGEVVTASTYKVGSRVDSRPPVDPEARAFARRMVDLWQVDRAYALDIALTPGGPKVVEPNCFNSAGFYAADMDAIVQAVEAMTF